MKKTLLALATAFAMLFGMNSCYYEEGTVEVEWGFDTENNGIPSVDNMNMALYVCGELFPKMMETFKANGYTEMANYPNQVMSIKPINIKLMEKEVKILTEKAIASLPEGNPIPYNYDFIVRCRCGGKDWQIAYRKNMYTGEQN